MKYSVIYDAKPHSKFNQKKTVPSDLTEAHVIMSYGCRFQNLVRAVTCTAALGVVGWPLTLRADCDGSAASRKSPFEDRVLRAAIPRRIAAERRLREYLDAARRNHTTVPSADEVELAAQTIIYGTATPHARRDHLRKYGCARWTDAALELIAAQSPLIEIGSGSGRWAHQLRLRGADVLAFDNHSSLAPPSEGSEHAALTAVSRGDETQLLVCSPTRTLFLCYPPGMNRMAERCAKLYTGQCIVYVGEGRGGVNGNAAFFDELDAQWDVERCVELEPFPESYEKLYVLQRRTRR